MGKFITMEGVEGAGKSTHMATVRDFLLRHQIEFEQTREPGGTDFAESIRDLLLQVQEEEVDSLCELLLVFAARAQHLARLIRPALEQGSWVLCDRFTDATYAYQAGGRGLPEEAIATLENLVQQSLRPDLTIILDLDPEIGLERARQRAELDRFEREQLAFFHRVRSMYLHRAEQNPGRYLVIDAGHELDTVREDLQRQLARRLGDWGCKLESA